MKESMSLRVRGKQHEWCFTIKGDPQFLEEWRADGLEVELVYASIPAWMVSIPLLPAVYVKLQRIVKFLF